MFSPLICDSIEALGRMCLTGLLLDPEVRTSSLFSFPTLSRVSHGVENPFSLPRSLHTRTSSLATGLTRVPPSSSPSQDQNQRSTSPSPITNSGVTDSHLDAVVSPPFRLDLQVARSKAMRNIPYLRQGWGRIDFLAVIGFWVSFALATGGLERGSQHIGIFSALSVLRTARLLAVTSGTAVSDITSLFCFYTIFHAAL